MNAWNYFNKIYYVNLDNRPDRREKVLSEFEKVHINDATRIPGIIYNGFETKKQNAAMGNHLSHAKALEDAVARNLKNCVIFEDDVEFFPGAFYTLYNVIKELPDSWDMLYFGINMDQYYAYQVSDHLAKLSGGFATHAYAVKNTLFEKLIKLNQTEIPVPNDVRYSTEIIPFHGCYVSIPLMAGQAESYSDIEGKVMSSNSMFLQRFNERLVKINVEN